MQFGVKQKDKDPALSYTNLFNAISTNYFKLAYPISSIISFNISFSLHNGHFIGKFLISYKAL